MLFGAAVQSGPLGGGTVFSLNTDGSNFTVLHSFGQLSNTTYVDGVSPYGQLLLVGNTLYGTTSYGGAQNDGTIFKVNTNGSGFTVLYNFTLGYMADYGALGPDSGLVTDGKYLYGTISNGGPGMGKGVLYRVNLDGSGYRSLYAFGANGTLDGLLPLGGLVLSGGTLYGSATIYGSGNEGTVYSLQLPAPPLISSCTQSDGACVLSWSTVVGYTYQVQYSNDLSSTNWSNLGAAFTATDTTLSATNAIGSDPNGFYRVVLLMP